jgi:hypothetical protein
MPDPTGASRDIRVIILTALKCDIDRCLKWGVFLCGIGAVSACVWVIFIFFSGAGILDALNESNGKKRTQAAYLYPLDAIGSGPLSLRPKIACGWVSRIAEEFSIIAFNSRPDVLQKEAKILVALQGGKEQSTIHNGKMLFLQERSEGKGLELSDAAGPLWVKPILLDNGSVLVEAGRKLISKEGVIIGEEKGEFIASLQKNAPFRHLENQVAPLSELKKGIHLGQDPLIAKYGGKEYAAWKDKIKVEFSSEDRTYAVFASAGDLMQFRDREWRIIADHPIDPELPLAQVLSASGKDVEMQGWDESGFFSIQVKIDGTKPSAPAAPPDLLPTSLRMRSTTQISCILGKKRLIIKKGDWLLKTSSGWRNLRKADEIEDCLYHRLKGELLIFDGIDKQQGKTVLTGHLFDKNRVSATFVSLPIDAEKKESHKTFRKDKQI